MLIKNKIYPGLVILTNICLIIPAIKFSFIDRDCSQYQYNDISVSTIIIVSTSVNILCAIGLIIETTISDKNKLTHQTNICIWTTHVCWLVFSGLVGMILLGITKCDATNPLMLTGWIFEGITLLEIIISILFVIKSFREYHYYIEYLHPMI